MNKVDDESGFKGMKDAIKEARQKGISIDFMMKLVEEGTKSFRIGANPITEDDSFDIVTIMIAFHIRVDRAKEIVVHIKKLMKDYNGSVADILRDIYHNIVTYEKYFEIYILGKNFREPFSKMAEKEFIDFLNPINQKLDPSDLLSLVEYVSDMVKQEKPGVSPIESIKKIIESDFEENDKVVAVFLYSII